jgi:CheY-like chemotaxis protein
MSAQAIVWIARDLDYMLLVRRCFRQRGVENPVVLLTSGELALSFLKMEASGNPLPRVVVTEISLPQMDGYELLRGIKTDSRFSNVPILLLGTAAQLNAKQAREFAGVHLAHKPALEEIPELVSGIIERWVPL